MNDRLKKLEEEKLKPIPVKDIQLVVFSKPVMDTHLELKTLDFNTPQSMKRHSGSFMGTPSTPATPLNSDHISDVDSLSSKNTYTSVTPDMQKLNLGRCRGQPRKELMEPNMDDYPVNATEEEQQRYIHKKNTER